MTPEQSIIGGIEENQHIRNCLQENLWMRQIEMTIGQAWAWPEDFMTSDQFESAFYFTWPENIQSKGIAAWLEERKAQDGHSYVLNFMGSTVVLENLSGSYTAGIALCLSPIAKPWHEKNGIHVVDGDVLLEETWEKLHATMERFAIPGFSLILSTPKDGFSDKHISHNMDIAWEIYNRLYTLLLPDGILACQATEELGRNREIFDAWINTIAATDPDDPPARRGYQKFSLVKTDKLASLPRFPVIS
jgi:hypothetical protein